MIHTRYGLDFDDLYNLVRDKIRIVKCKDCDINGVQYWDNRYDEGLQNNPSGIDPEYLDRGSCENCHGLGYLLLEK